MGGRKFDVADWSSGVRMHVFGFRFVLAGDDDDDSDADALRGGWMHLPLGRALDTEVFMCSDDTFEISVFLCSRVGSETLGDRVVLFKPPCTS